MCIFSFLFPLNHLVILSDWSQWIRSHSSYYNNNKTKGCSNTLNGPFPPPINHIVIALYVMKCIPWSWLTEEMLCIWTMITKIKHFYDFLLIFTKFNGWIFSLFSKDLASMFTLHWDSNKACIPGQSNITHPLCVVNQQLFSHFHHSLKWFLLVHK